MITSKVFDIDLYLQLGYTEAQIKQKLLANNDNNTANLLIKLAASNINSQKQEEFNKLKSLPIAFKIRELAK